VDIGIQIAAGWPKPTASGFVHRDLKPQNVMIDREERPRSWISAWPFR
jgi:serine/threonine protein kinase